jgi:hypothetical protein
MLIIILVVVLFFTGAISTTFVGVGPERQPIPSSDPFFYCKDVGTIDAPGQSYVGPKVPETIARGLQSAFQALASAPLKPFLENSFWRCMDGKVYACSGGANLPCTAQANTSREPTAAIVKFCAVNRQVSAIPMVVTGRATVYAWKCEAGKPAIVRESVKPDKRGFLSNIWYEMSPPAKTLPGKGDKPH